MGAVFGVDHVCLSADDLDARAGELARRGFKPLFEEKKLAVSEHKKKFLRRPVDLHDMVFMKAASGVSIELIAHHAALPLQKGPYELTIPDGAALSARLACYDPDLVS